MVVWMHMIWQVPAVILDVYQLDANPHINKLLTVKRKVCSSMRSLIGVIPSKFIARLINFLVSFQWLRKTGAGVGAQAISISPSIIIASNLTITISNNRVTHSVT